MLKEQEIAASASKAGVLPCPRFSFKCSGAQEGCQKCGDPLHLRATRRRRVLSLVHGQFLAIEKQGYCPVHPRLPPARSWELDRIVPRGSNVAFDVMVRVGLARFLQCRQIGEIQAELSRQYGIEMPARTIGYQAQKFVAYVQVVHQESVHLLRNDMAKRGGYILHVDGTCEEGSRVLLVCLDSLSEQVLESLKIASESTQEVRYVLKGVLQDWGVPLGVVHDLRKSLITAAGEVFPEVPQFVCHYHLAADDVEERLFRTIKRQCRRLHGRGHLSRDVDAMAAGTALVLNLDKAEYCQTVYGGSDPESIAQRFSCVDPKTPARLMESWRRERLATRIPRKYEGLEDLPQRLAPFIAVASEAFQTQE